MNNRIIKFTANVMGGMILDKPKEVLIKCPVIALGKREIRGFNSDACLIKVDAFVIEYRKQMFGSIHFDQESWAAYINVMCSNCCNDAEYVSDIDFLTQNNYL